jgi:hypothetical protein
VKIWNLLFSGPLLALSSFSTQAAQTIYNVTRSFQEIQVSGLPLASAGGIAGSITTDGTLGQLAASNITSFSLTLSYGNGQSIVMTPLTTIFSIDPSLATLISADTSNIYFDFSPSPTLAAAPAYATASFTERLTLNTWAFAPHAATAGAREAFAIDSGHFSSSPEQTGLLAFATVSPIPEPSEWIMMLAGLAVISAAAKRRKTVKRLA